MGLVSTSATFLSDRMKKKCRIPAATASITRCYEQPWCFFFNVELGTVVLSTTLWLSPYKTALALTGTPNIRNLYRSSIIMSAAIRAETNLES